MAKSISAAVISVGLGLLAMLLATSEAGAFPSLFDRPSFFKRQQQQQPQAIQMNPAELMRISGMHRHQPGAHQLHPFARQPSAASESGQLSLDSAAAAYFKPSVVNADAHEQQQSQYADSIQPSPFDLFDNAAPTYLQRAASQPPRSALTGASGLHLEPTHTSEVVDKIEQHIDRQIEQSLGEQQPEQHQQQHQHQNQPPAHLLLYGQPDGAFRQAATGGYAKSAGEKEASASGESSEGGESSEAEGAEEKAEEKAEKRLEGGGHEVKEGHTHEHHHEEHPPEAFEVHHKKGGKSFQYFHQGHSH